MTLLVKYPVLFCRLTNMNRATALTDRRIILKRHKNDGVSLVNSYLCTNKAKEKYDRAI